MGRRLRSSAQIRLRTGNSRTLARNGEQSNYVGPLLSVRGEHSESLGKRRPRPETPLENARTVAPCPTVSISGRNAPLGANQRAPLLKKLFVAQALIAGVGLKPCLPHCVCPTREMIQNVILR